MVVMQFTNGGKSKAFAHHKRHLIMVIMMMMMIAFQFTKVLVYHYRCNNIAKDNRLWGHTVSPNAIGKKELPSSM